MKHREPVREVKSVGGSIRTRPSGFVLGLITAAASCLVLVQTTGAELRLQVLYQFQTTGENAYAPLGGLVESAEGDFYGSTIAGGTFGHGTVFRFARDGSLTTLVSFDGTNGASPRGSLIFAQDGNLYGTTAFGGIGFQKYSASITGNGIVFRVSTNGSLAPLHFFGRTNDGYGPSAGLILSSDGDFYGTTALGGTNGTALNPQGYGTMFRIRADGAFSTVYTFSGPDGSYPQAPLVEAQDGSFYGTTANGGTDFFGSFSSGRGTVFRMTPDGALTTVAMFQGTNGAVPYGGLTPGADGIFNGTTTAGGASTNGTIFQISSNGDLAMLVSLNGTNGRRPYVGLSKGGNDGALYGTTFYGGTNGDNGTVFRVTTNGTLTTLISFSGSDGRNPQAELLQARDGNWYGTTYQGGVSDGGTLFRLVELPTITEIKNGSSGLTVTWNSFFNGRYRVEHKSSLSDTNWNALFPVILATNTTASVADNTPAESERYYRVVLLP